MRPLVLGVLLGASVTGAVAWGQGALISPNPPNFVIAGGVDRDSGNAASLQFSKGRALADCGGDQLDRIERLVKATLVTTDGITFGKRGWNGLSAYTEVLRTQPNYLQAGPLR